MMNKDIEIKYNHKDLDNGGWSFDGKKVDDEIFHSVVEYTPEYREDLIESLNQWIPEAKDRNNGDYELMVADIKLLESKDDEIVLSSNSTNKFLFKGTDEYKEVCEEIKQAQQELKTTRDKKALSIINNKKEENISRELLESSMPLLVKAHLDEYLAEVDIHEITIDKISDDIYEDILSTNDFVKSFTKNSVIRDIDDFLNHNDILEMDVKNRLDESTRYMEEEVFNTETTRGKKNMNILNRLSDR